MADNTKKFKTDDVITIVVGMVLDPVNGRAASRAIIQHVCGLGEDSQTHGHLSFTAGIILDKVPDLRKLRTGELESSLALTGDDDRKKREIVANWLSAEKARLGLAGEIEIPAVDPKLPVAKKRFLRLRVAAAMARRGHS